MQHFSHQHPLVLTNEVPKEKGKPFCYGCQEAITTDPAYICTDCNNFFLHKKCGELPQGIIHPMHPQHPLTLLPHPPHHYTERGWFCDVCRSTPWYWFAYTCFECDFGVHVSCTPLEERKNDHIFHDHPLTFMQREASFFCDACGTKGEDLSYRCASESCQFWIHDTCASSINTIERYDHHHPLKLAYSIPYSYRKFDHYCYICNKMVYPTYWIYYCASCRYFAHLKCAKTEEEPFVLCDEDLDQDLVTLPAPGLTNLTSQIFMNICGRARIACPNSDSGSLIDGDVHRNKAMKYKQVLCDVCVQPIISSSPFSNCSKCSFVAHTRCTFLRRKISHPSHPQHLLTLFNTWSTFELFPCKICGGNTNGNFFSCTICDDFQIDVTCATISLPKKIKHEAHKHPLILKTEASTNKLGCKACHIVIDYGMKYECDAVGCDYSLDVNCAMLPGQFKFDWDDHPLSLTYPPFNHPDDYFCEICEEDIHPIQWLYHCSKCDHSFHTNCLHPHNHWSRVKYGITYKFDSHEHNLTFVQKARKSHPCDVCGKSHNAAPHLDCASCSYHVDFQCARSCNSKRIEFFSGRKLVHTM